MQTVKQLIQRKGDIVWSIRPEASVYEAIKMMAEKSIGALLVMQHGEIVGILSERDYARKVILQGRSSKDTPVSDIMSRNVIHAGPDDSVQECMALMTQKRIRHLPILENNQLTGMISIGDLVKAVIADQQFLIAQLENYIAS